MGEINTTSSIWKEIELSESYLVSTLYKEAVSTSSSVLKRILSSGSSSSSDSVTDEAFDEVEHDDMVECAAMVLVQSLNKLGRTSSIFKELNSLFGSAAAIPVQVLLSGASFQISEGSALAVREFLEDFLSKWSLIDGKHYVLTGVECGMDIKEGCDWRCVLEIDKYMEVVEVYVVGVLSLALKDLDHAIAWVEKAALTEKGRQELLRRLRSMYSCNATSSSQGFSSLPTNDVEARSLLKEFNISEGSQNVLETKYLPSKENHTKQTLFKLSGRKGLSFWWFHAITLKFGNTQVVISNRKIALGCLVFFTYLLLRRKREKTGFLKERLMSVKKAFVDLWQLAFSYQVNPLAAVQPFPTTTHGGR